LTKDVYNSTTEFPFYQRFQVILTQAKKAILNRKFISHLLLPASCPLPPFDKA